MRDGLRGIVSPTERAGHEHVDVARATEFHRALHLRFEVVQFGDGRRGDIRNLVRHGDHAAGSCLGRSAHRSQSPTGIVVFVRAAGGVADERCTPVFMYASLS